MLEEDVLNKVDELYETGFRTYVTIRDALRFYNIDFHPIELEYFLKEKYKINPDLFFSGCRTKPDLRIRVIKSYNRYRGDPKLARVSFEMGEASILGIWEEAGLEVKVNNRRRIGDLNRIP